MRIATDYQKHPSLVAHRIQEVTGEKPKYFGPPYFYFRFPVSGIIVTRDCDIRMDDSVSQQTIESIVMKLASWNICCRVYDR